MKNTNPHRFSLTSHFLEQHTTAAHDEKTLLRWLKIIALQQVEDLGPVSLATLLSAAGSVDGLLAGDFNAMQLPGVRSKSLSQLRQLQRNPEASPHWQFALRALQWVLLSQVSLLCKDDPAFPKLLKELPDCPPMLYLRGDQNALKKASIAIVGARKPTEDGVRFARQLAADLSSAGLQVVSGMALGIDSEAHAGALAAGGQTVAVWATGPDVVYPPRHRKLAAQIMSRGCAVTEMPPGTAASPGLFPRRNRLVSGLCLGVIVVQARLPSGSLITAGYAAEQNREVFARPGPVSCELSAGCHQLIRDGATLVESADDVLAVIGELRAAHNPPLSVSNHQGPISGQRDALPPITIQAEAIDELPQDLRQVMAVIGCDPVPVETIDARLEQQYDNLPSLLVELELQGLLVVSAGLYCRAVN